MNFAVYGFRVDAVRSSDEAGLRPPLCQRLAVAVLGAAGLYTQPARHKLLAGQHTQLSTVVIGSPRSPMRRGRHRQAPPRSGSATPSHRRRSLVASLRVPAIHSVSCALLVYLAERNAHIAQGYECCSSSGMVPRVAPHRCSVDVMEGKVTLLKRCI